MTPEEARALLDATRQGTQDGQRPVTVAAKYAPLAEAAYGLAQIVANLRYEYAVQVKGGWWVGENDAGELVPTTDPMRALRHYHPDVALKLAEEAGKQLGHECCVARRLATDWEVTE